MNSDQITHITAEPPVGQVTHLWDEKSSTLTYHYNGRQIVSVTLSPTVGARFRHHSDGNIQSMPFAQQVYIMCERPITANVSFRLSNDSLNIKPHRAAGGEAILGQLGRPLMFGVNGLYDIIQDLLIDWHGAQWKWTTECLQTDSEGDLTCELEVELGTCPWFLNLRMQYYKQHLNYRFHKPWEWRPNLKPIAGWCSWEAYRDEVTEDDIGRAAAYISETFKDHGMEYIQIDDGYQISPVPPTPDGMVSDSWINTNYKFPAGHKGVINDITSKGLLPGIWTNAVVTNQRFADEYEFCLRDVEGKALEGDWIHYVLDCLPETLAKHVAPYYKGLKELGYTYFKTDAVRHLIYDGLQEAVRRGILTNEECETRFRAFLECARSNVGQDTYFLSCWGIMTQAVGIADAMRIATDADPSWASIKMQLVESARWFHTQRILFVNDPDHICARTNIEWARTALSLVSLTGSVFMLSDSPDKYDEDRVRIIQQTLPPLTTVTAEVGPLDVNYPAFVWMNRLDENDNVLPHMTDSHPFSTLWSFHFHLNNRQWCVLGRFAVQNLNATDIQLEMVGLDPEKNYHVFDFWDQKYLGSVSETLSCGELPRGTCQILSLIPDLQHPQFIASSRHVSMDAVSIVSERWDSGEMELVLKGIKGTRENYWIHSPSRFSMRTVISDEFDISSYVSSDELGHVIRICVNFRKETGLLRVSFDGYSKVNVNP